MEILKYIASLASVSTLFYFLGTKAIDSYFSTKLAAYKAELDRANLEHSVKYQQLHVERAEKIKDIYAKLTALDNSLARALMPFQQTDQPSLDEKVNTASRNFNSLVESYTPNKLFFKKETCDLVEGILNAAIVAAFHLGTYPVDPKDRDAFWKKARKIHEEEISKLKEQLESEFRTMLGV